MEMYYRDMCHAMLSEATRSLRFKIDHMLDKFTTPGDYNPHDRNHYITIGFASVADVRAVAALGRVPGGDGRGSGSACGGQSGRSSVLGMQSGIGGASASVMSASASVGRLGLGGFRGGGVSGGIASEVGSGAAAGGVAGPRVLSGRRPLLSSQSANALNVKRR